MSLGAFDVVLTVVVMVAVAVFILVFERRRAREIEHDLREQRRTRDIQQGRPQ